MTGKILIVDDEPGIRDVMKSFAEFRGHKVKTAANGVEALDSIRTENFDVVVSDIQMPQMDGLMLAEEAHKIQPDAVIILMTGFASVNTAIEAIKKDVFDYIIKPFHNMHVVTQTIERGIDRKRMVQERRALIDDLKRANDELTYNRTLLDEKIRVIDSELGRRIQRLTTLYEISRSISSITDSDQLLHTILQSIARTFQDTAGVIWLIDSKSKILHQKAMIGLKIAKMLPDNIMFGEGEIGAAVNSGVVRVFRSLAELSDPVLADVCGKNSISSIIMVPFIYETETLGVIAVLFRNNYSITDDDVSLLKAIADQASVSVKNMELFAEQQKMFRETIEALATAIDSRDHYTGGHSFMVTQYAITIARKMNLPEDQLDLIQIAGLLHDIGKIGISDDILNKPGKLTDEEMGIIKAHPLLGRTIVESIEALKNVAKIIYFHHEHYDGSGYPEKRSGDSIPLISRILTIADIFHALTSDRIYRKAMPFEKALSIMREEMGKTIDPDIGEVFFELVKEEKILPPLIQLTRPADFY